MKSPKILIKLTSEFHPSDGTWNPVSSKYIADLHERISYRGTNPVFHIKECRPRRKQLTKDERQDRYGVRCLEKGIRPYNYPDDLWNEYLRDVESEEHINRCEVKMAFMYEY